MVSVDEVSQIPSNSPLIVLSPCLFSAAVDDFTGKYIREELPSDTTSNYIPKGVRTALAPASIDENGSVASHGSGAGVQLASVRTPLLTPNSAHSSQGSRPAFEFDPTHVRTMQQPHQRRPSQQSHYTHRSHPSGDPQYYGDGMGFEADPGYVEMGYGGPPPPPHHRGYGSTDSGMGSPNPSRLSNRSLPPQQPPLYEEPVHNPMGSPRAVVLTVDEQGEQDAVYLHGQVGGYHADEDRLQRVMRMQPPPAQASPHMDPAYTPAGYGTKT